MPVLIRSVKFWINAFIPKDVPDYTRPVPAGPHRGKSMIPGAQRIPGGVVRGVPELRFSDCFLTDQRSFSNQIHAKSRMHSEFKLTLGAWPPTLTQWHRCDPTTEVDCEDGDVECTDTGSTARMRFALLHSHRVCSPSGPFIVEMSCASSNPCAPSSRLGGDIDYHGRIIVAPVARRIDIDLAVDAFPSFEAYATINDGAGVPLFQMAPPAGNTVWNLPRAANRPVRKRLEDRNEDGVFETLSDLRP